VPRVPDFASSEVVFASPGKFFARSEELPASYSPSFVFHFLLFERSEGEIETRELSFERRSPPCGRPSLPFASFEGLVAWHSLESASSEEEGTSSEGVCG
jgi:hypothetical protein